MEKLRIELTADEQEDLIPSGVAVEFMVHRGYLTISQDWGETDELYGDGCSVGIPARVWNEAMPWIVEHMARAAQPKASIG